MVAYGSLIYKQSLPLSQNYSNHCVCVLSTIKINFFAFQLFSLIGKTIAKLFPPLALVIYISCLAMSTGKKIPDMFLRAMKRKTDAISDSTNLPSPKRSHSGEKQVYLYFYIYNTL